MAKPIITKPCTKCQEVKPLDDYHHNHTAYDGHQPRCKECIKQDKAKYRKTDVYRQCQIRYAASESGKEAMDRAREKRRQSGYDAEYAKRYREQHPERELAHYAVNRAQHYGTLPKPNTLPCANCGAPAQHWHHHKGYDEEHRLDVVALCCPCHGAAHVAQGK